MGGGGGDGLVGLLIWTEVYGWVKSSPAMLAATAGRCHHRHGRRGLLQLPFELSQLPLQQADLLRPPAPALSLVNDAFDIDAVPNLLGECALDLLEF